MKDEDKMTVITDVVKLYKLGGMDAAEALATIVPFIKETSEEKAEAEQRLSLSSLGLRSRRTGRMEP